MKPYPTIALPLPARTDAGRIAAARDFAGRLSRKRTVREVAPTSMPRDAIAPRLHAAGIRPQNGRTSPRRVVGPAAEGGRAPHEDAGFP